MKKYNASKEALLVAALAIALLFAKAPHRILNGYLWAEDGPQFLGSAYVLGISSLKLQYAGYLHTIPRIISLIQAWVLPVRAAPHFLVITCLILSAASSAYIYQALLRFEWQRKPKLMSVLMAVTPWLAPQSGEVFLNVTNLQWVLAPAFMVFIWDTIAVDRDKDMSTGNIVFRMICMVVLSTTGPMGVFALPLAIVCWAYRARKQGMREGAGDAPVLLAYFAGSAIQLLVYANNRQNIPGNELSWTHELGTHLLAPLVIAPSAVDSSFYASALATTAILISVAVGLTIRQARAAILMIMFIAGASWAGGMLKTPTGAPHMIWDGPASRYTYPAGVAILWSIILIWGSAPKKFGVAFSAVLGVMIVLNGMPRFALDDGQDWTMVRKGDVYEVHAPPGWITVLPASAKAK